MIHHKSLTQQQRTDQLDNIKTDLNITFTEILTIVRVLRKKLIDAANGLVDVNEPMRSVVKAAWDDRERSVHRVLSAQSIRTMKRKVSAAGGSVARFLFGAKKD